MSAPLYSLEESIERAVAAALSEQEELANITCVHSDRSEEVGLPKIVCKAERTNALVHGSESGVWQARLTVTLTVPADDPDAGDAQPAGADEFSVAWAAVAWLLPDLDFIATVNAFDLCNVWAMELTDSASDNGERAFVRSLTFGLWASEVAEDDE
jgi:hypothetical protein